jgi:hypothetical protein
MNPIKSAIIQNSRYGVKDRCLEFEAGDYVNCGNDASLQLTERFSLEMWLYPIGVLGGSVNRWYFGKWRGLVADRGYSLRTLVSDNHNIGVSVRNAADTSHINLFSGYKRDENVGKWVHIAATYDKDTYLKIYINGDEANSADAIGIAQNSPLNFEIGAADGGFLGIIGRIDEGRVWNHARTAAQIKRYMHTRLYGTETGLVAYYPMDKLREVDMSPDPNEFYTDDKSQNSNHGLVVGATQITP